MKFTKKLVLSALTKYVPYVLPETTLYAAVMVIILVNDDLSLEIVLTKRASSLHFYAGDVSFPGGMHEPADVDLYETACREVAEELGLPNHLYERIAQLDDFQDRFGNLVRPFVCVMDKHNFENIFIKSDAEITQVIYFPLEKLFAITEDTTSSIVTRRHPSYIFKENDILIWGLTAAILMHLYNIITGDHKPLGKLVPAPTKN